jgi:cadmium resistance protein CadD (predicted permease)
VCRASAYFAVGLLMVLSLLLHTLSVRFTRVNAYQYLGVLTVLYVSYLALLPLTFRAWADVCEVVP